MSFKNNNHHRFIEVGFSFGTKYCEKLTIINRRSEIYPFNHFSTPLKLQDQKRCTMKVWQKKSKEEIKTRVFEALKLNTNYANTGVLGVPASYLDDEIFNQDAAFLKNAPYMSALVQNPNHIGCHTLGKSESFFAGTQAIEKELIEICAVDILKGKINEQDGYVASGGTEANIQAIWVYRNFFKNTLKAKNKDIAIVCSEDSHYSMDKAANLLSLDIYKVKVDKETRAWSKNTIENCLEKLKDQNKEHVIVICNMMTTMFGSVDNIDTILPLLKSNNFNYKIHIDGAYGGFYYPFTNKSNSLNFANKEVSSVTLDAHKTAQSPYGTGIFLIRKNLISNVNTSEASYVEGEDYTLIGSRSGANAIAVWMILSNYGAFGWMEKLYVLQKRTAWFTNALSQLGINYFRNPFSNIVTIKTESISSKLAHKYGLVPDNHLNPKWYKVVIMDHVSIEKLSPLIEDLKVK